MLRDLLDTHIVIYVLKRRPIEVLSIFNANASRMAISSIALAELLHAGPPPGGTRRARRLPLGRVALSAGRPGRFVANQHGTAAPPFVELRELEAASLPLQRDKDNTAAAGDAWLRMLIAPAGRSGASGPRPDPFRGTVLPRPGARGR